MGELPQSCQVGRSLSCENAVFYYLDKARETMGLPPYALPANFPTQSDDRQIFILSNLDRLAYLEHPVAGLNAGLGGDAMQGVAEGEDPTTSGNEGYPWGGFASNWAFGFVNAPAAYYFWMYDDGYGSPNLDCRTPSDDGCWGHRRDVFLDAAGIHEFGMGAANGLEQGSKQPSWAMIIASANPEQPPPYYYTWVEAQAEGAGSNPYDPGVPDLRSTTTNEKHPRIRLLVHGSTARVKADPILDGRRVTFSIRRTWVPCAVRLNAGRCTWVPKGRPTRLSTRLSRKTAIRFRRPGNWERVTIRAQSKPFSVGSQHYAGAQDSASLSGPKPHHAAA